MTQSPDHKPEPGSAPEALIDAHLDGVITDAQSASLQQWILATPDNAKAFARRAMDHDHLHQIYSSDRVAKLVNELGGNLKPDPASDSWSHLIALLEEAEEKAEPALVDLTQRLEDEKREKSRKKQQLKLASQPAETNKPRTRMIVIPWVAVYGAGLATAAIIALVLSPLFNKTPNTTTPPTAENPRQNEVAAAPVRPTPEPVPPATLVASHQTVWAADSLLADDHDALWLGDYAIEAGFVQLAMLDGTSLIVEGPASFSIDSQSRVSLTHGALSALVPEGAEGFIVDTPAGQVLDLGTEFGVEVLEEGAIEIHVMDGEVVATLPDESLTQNMLAGQARRMDAGTAQIEAVPAHGEKFARSWEQVERSVRVSDAVRYLYDTPSSVAAGALEDNDLLFILPEKRGVTVPHYTVLCDFLEPGRYERLPRDSRAIPGGTIVDSYLLHYDRVGTPLEGLISVEGTIHFDRPIIGVIANNEWIGACDAMFQGEGTEYPDADYAGRGFEGREHRADGIRQDIVTISADRRTLTVHLETSTNIDQLRVLVEAAPEVDAD